MIYTGGQVDLDPRGNVQNPGNLDAQCKNSLDYLDAVLADLGADFDDLVKLIVYFVGDAQAEAAILDEIASRLGNDCHPTVCTIPMPELCYPDMLVEIEGIAMRAEDGSRMSRKCVHDNSFPQLPEAFSHVIKCGEMIFTSDMSALSPTGEVESPGDILAQSKIMMSRLSGALDLVGADMDDVLKLNIFYAGDGTAEDWERSAKIRAGFFNEPGPAATGIPVLGFPQPGLMTKISVTAMRDRNNNRIEKRYSWPDGHWDWTTHLPYKHGNKCGHMIHLGGQVSLDTSANVIDPDDMVAQTRRAMENIKRILADFGATLDDVVKVTTFYEGEASAEALHENLLIRSNSYTPPGPATTGIPVPCLVYERMVIEIEVIAMIEG